MLQIIVMYICLGVCAIMLGGIFVSIIKETIFETKIRNKNKMNESEAREMHISRIPAMQHKTEMLERELYNYQRKLDLLLKELGYEIEPEQTVALKKKGEK